jgi:DNA-binding CsgD family transcriptional regulator
MAERDETSQQPDEFQQLIAPFYEAVLDDKHWEPALAGLCRAFGSKGVSLLAQHRVTGRVHIALSHGVPEDALLAYEKGPSGLDPLRRYTLANPHCELIYEYLHTPEHEIDNSTFHRLMERRSGIRYRVCAKLFEADDVTAFVALQRTRDQGHPDNRLLSSCMRIVPHLARAVRIAHRLDDLALTANTTMQALGDLPIGILVIDKTGAVSYLNGAAAAVIEAGDALAIGATGLVALRKVDNEQLQRELANAFDFRAPAGSGMALRRKSGKRPYAVQLVPASDRYAVFAGTGPRVIMFVTDPERSTKTPDEWLQRLFGLTRRQAQLANHLADGLVLAEASAIMGITEKTARSHLEEVFGKTGTRRQSELVRLIAALPPA